MSYTIHILDQQRLIDRDGVVVGGTIAFYYTGTNVLAPIYLDTGLTVPMTNPVVIDGDGDVPRIYLDSTVTYRRRITYPDGSFDDDDPVFGLDPLLQQITTPTGAYNVGFQATGTGAVVSNVGKELDRQVWAERFGAVGVSMADFLAMSGAAQTALASANSTAILAAVARLRTNPVTLSTDGLNSGPFTAYSSGELLFGEGFFPIAPDTLKFTQDLGLIIKGRGSRKTNNAVYGRTTLLIVGNGQFGIQFYANGARAAVFEDIDITYHGNVFTGDVIDNFGSPGMVITRCHIGTNGVSGATRYQTARSLFRSTYGEFVHFIDTTFDGAIDGVWFDDTREPPIGPPIEFGGSGMLLTSSVVYDVTGSMVRADGNRNLKKLALRDCAFNPISVNCTHALKLNNVDALAVEGCLFSPSVSSIPTGGWLNIVNCTGEIVENEFLGPCNLTVSTGIDGNLTIDNNFIDSDQGFILRGGIFKGSGNEFSRCSSGWKTVAAPPRTLSFRVGPDIFSATNVSRSYDVDTDNANLDGVVDYVDSLDSSVNRFRNVSGRVAIRNPTGKRITIGTTPYAVNRTDTGYRIELTQANHTATLPAVSNPGLRYTFFTNGTNVIIIQGPSGSIAAGSGPAKTTMTSTASNVGSLVTVENFGGLWNVVEQIGAFALA